MYLLLSFTSLFLIPWIASGVLASDVAADSAPESGDGYFRFPVQNLQQTGTGLVRRQSSLDALNSGYGTTYYINLNIGTPSQSIYLILDTGSPLTWVNPNCYSLDESQKSFCLGISPYNPQTSNTSSPLSGNWSISYGDGSLGAMGVYYVEKVQVGDQTLEKFPLAVATDSAGISAGIFGMSPVVSGTLQYISVLQDFVLSGRIQSAAFSLDIRSWQIDGSLILGGVDTKKYACDLQRLPIISPPATPIGANGWWIHLTGIGISRSGQDSKIYSQEVFNPSGDTAGLPVLIDSGTTVTYLPQALVEAIVNDYPQTATLNQADGLYHVPCDALEGTIDFHFGGKTVKVPFSEFIWHGKPDDCALGILPVFAPNGNILGDSFLHAAYVVFDQDNQEIWVDQTADCGSAIVPIGKGVDAVPQVKGCSCPVSSTSSSLTSLPTSSVSASTVSASDATFSEFATASNTAVESVSTSSRSQRRTRTRSTSVPTTLSKRPSSTSHAHLPTDPPASIRGGRYTRTGKEATRTASGRKGRSSDADGHATHKPTALAAKPSGRVANSAGDPHSAIRGQGQRWDPAPHDVEDSNEDEDEEEAHVGENEDVEVGGDDDDEGEDAEGHVESGESGDDEEDHDDEEDRDAEEDQDVEEGNDTEEGDGAEESGEINNNDADTGEVEESSSAVEDSHESRHRTSRYRHQHHRGRGRGRGRQNRKSSDEGDREENEED